MGQLSSHLYHLVTLDSDQGNCKWNLAWGESPSHETPINEENSQASLPVQVVLGYIICLL